MWEVRISLNISAIFGSPVLEVFCVVPLRFLPASALFPELCFAPPNSCILVFEMVVVGLVLVRDLLGYY